MKLKYLVISDIHLGNKRTRSEFIINNLKEYLNVDILKSIDVLFIAGDFFDRLLNLNSAETYEIMFFIRVLLERCSKCGCMVRVLKGTHSHDFEQCRLFVNVYDCIKDTYNLDFKYIDKLCIDEIKSYKVLFLPDEWKPTAEMIYKDIRALLNFKKIQQVDLIIMHGMFSFQLPSHIKSPLIHNELDFLKICKYYIHPGHIHTNAVFDRIYAQGSFDRLAHNEESPKGAYLCEIGEEDVKPRFIENKNAKKYVTININKKNLDEVILRITKLISKLPTDSHIRLKGSIESEGILYIKKLQEKFFDYNLSIKVLEKDKDKKLEREATSVYKPISITQDNISSLLKDIYYKREDLDSNKKESLDKFVKKLLENK